MVFYFVYLLFLFCKSTIICSSVPILPTIPNCPFHIQTSEVDIFSINHVNLQFEPYDDSNANSANTTQSMILMDSCHVYIVMDFEPI